MALLTKQTIQVTGTTPTYGAASAGGDTVRPGERTVLHVLNADASPKTVTVVVPGTRFGQANPDVAVTVAAGEEEFILLTREQADADGLVSITYSDVTSLTVAALSI